MGSAPTPPAQTPVTFLRGGAADMFSAECKAALLKAGYDPAWFGSYSHVSKQIKAAKDKVAKYEDAVNKGRKRLPPKPSKTDKYLATCQSGHLTQNAVFQEPGGRGDPCSNLDSAPGHSTNDYPCMPQAGHATQDGGEHERATEHEKDSAGAQGDPGDPYPGKEIAKDSDDRGKKIADDKKLAKANDREAITKKGATEGASAGGGAKSGKSVSAASGASGRSASKPNEPWNKPITGKTAGDCINAFRKAGEAAMRAKCRDEVEKNAAIANGPSAKTQKDGQDYRAALDQKAEDAKKAAKAAPNNEKKQKAARDAQAKATRAKNADCLARQGRKLRRDGIDGPFDGQVPTNANHEDSAAVSGGFS
jgi:hypothetical protein